MKTLHPLEGHENPRRAVTRAFLAGRLPPSLLLHGPAGVGKQRFALWMGQLILCAAPTLEGPCGQCKDCRTAMGLQHPDLHWFFPFKKPPTKGSKERDDEALEETRREILEARRETPLHPTYTEEIRGLYFGTIRALRKEASRRPAVAPRRLFIVADAEELVAQESAQEAANALLKTLEEPPPETWVVLTSSEPGRLLPTIRSRTTAIHLPPLPRDRVQAFLERETAGSKEEVEKAVALSGGAIGHALGYLPDGGEDGPLEKIRKDAFRLLRTAIAPGPAGRYSRALAETPWGARGLRDLLSALETWIRDLAAVAAVAEAPILNADNRAWLEQTVREVGIHPARAARSIARVERTRREADGNVNPQLLVNRLLFGLHDDLVTPTKPFVRPDTAETR